MKKFRNLKQKIIFYVMSVSILLTVLITAVMSFGSIRSTNKLQLDNIQVTTRIASQSISSNLHLLTERIYNISTDAELTDDSLPKKDKAAYLQDFEQEIEFVCFLSMMPMVKNFTATRPHRIPSPIPNITPS